MKPDEVQKHREELQELAERDDLRVSNYAKVLLEVLNAGEGA